VRQEYKHPDQIIEMLIDIASKNGTMLLNVLQRPDGAIDDEARYILSELATWFPAAGEGLYGTRPWKTFGEGNTLVTIQGFTENKTAWTPGDIRYTQKGKTVYAFLMGGTQNGVAVLRSFNEGERIENVRLLGAGSVPFTHEMGVLTVKLPERMPSAYTSVLAVELKL
jgi:alpha-L-fucosidase